MDPMVPATSKSAEESAENWHFPSPEPVPQEPTRRTRPPRRRSSENLAAEPATKRTSVSKRLRFEILRRDQFRCRYCGTSAGERELRLDHVIPVALGGRTEPSNLAACCQPCNAGKTSVSLDGPVVEDIAQDALRWSRAMELAAAQHRAGREERNRHRTDFHATWHRWTFAYGSESVHCPLPDEWFNSIDAFIDAGLDDTDLADAIHVAMSKKSVSLESTWRYFCGVCWRRIDSLRENAGRLFDSIPTEVTP